MSLIDEALKRAQAAQQESAKEGAARPWAPTPLPDTRPMRRRQVVRTLAGGLAAILLAAAAFLFLRRGASEEKEQSGDAIASEHAAGSVAASGVPSETALPEMTSEVRVAPPPRGERKTFEPRMPVTRPKPPPAATETSRVATAPSDFPRRPTDGAAGLPSPAAEEKGAQSPAKARTYAGEATLPGGGKITLEGIVFSEENPTALVNGRVVSRGGFVEGYEVVRIQPDRVELRGDAGNIVIVLK